MTEPGELEGESRMLIGEATSVVAWDTNALVRDLVLPVTEEACAQRMVRLDGSSALMADSEGEVATAHEQYHASANRPRRRS